MKYLRDKFDNKLYIDFLEKLYSKISIEVESKSDTVRKAYLVVQLGKTRTYAITHFHALKWAEEIKVIAAEIKSGKIIGKTFDDWNYHIKEGGCLHNECWSLRLSKREVRHSAMQGSGSPVHFQRIE